MALKQWVRPVAYCEIDPYCQGVLFSRMASNDLCMAPVWGNVSTLEGEQFRGTVDIIYGGFPCQDISIAGLGKGLAGKRSGLFFEIKRLVYEILPSYVFLENVPAITFRGGARVVSEIASLGYDCRWLVISAASVGALHKRERFYLLAHHNSESGGKANTRTITNSEEQKTRIRFARQDRRIETRTYWQKNKCPSFGMDDGLSFELDRASGLGNAVVTDQAKEAFKILMGLK